MLRTQTCLLSAMFILVTSSAFAQQDEAKPPTQVELADGKLTLPVAGDWKSVEPRSRIVQFEFSIPAAEGDEKPGRLTIMAAGGSIDANIARWVGQFRSADGKPLADDAKKVERKKVSDLDVHVVDLSGSYQDKARPFGPGVNRPDYRMLAAIVPTKGHGVWFIKSYGPRETSAHVRTAT